MTSAKILREVLTSWVPVVLEDSDGIVAPSAEPADLPLELEETVNAMLNALDEADRTVLGIKLAGEPDSALAAVLGASQPTAGNRKMMACDRLREAWARAGIREARDSIRVAEELYARLQTRGSRGA